MWILKKEKLKKTYKDINSILNSENLIEIRNFYR